MLALHKQQSHAMVSLACTNLVCSICRKYVSGSDVSKPCPIWDPGSWAWGAFLDSG